MQYECKFAARTLRELMEKGQKLYADERLLCQPEELADSFQQDCAGTNSQKSGHLKQQLLPFCGTVESASKPETKPELQRTECCNCKGSTTPTPPNFNTATAAATVTARCSFCLRYNCFNCTRTCSKCFTIVCLQCTCLDYTKTGIGQFCPPCVETNAYDATQDEDVDTPMG